MNLLSNWAKIQSKRKKFRSLFIPKFSILLFIPGRWLRITLMLRTCCKRQVPFSFSFSFSLKLINLSPSALFRTHFCINFSMFWNWIRGWQVCFFSAATSGVDICFCVPFANRILLSDFCFISVCLSNLCKILIIENFFLLFLKKSENLRFSFLCQNPFYFRFCFYFSLKHQKKWSILIT